MAALLRGMSVTGGSLLGRLWQGGRVEARRPVRALRRRPVRVLYPGEAAAGRASQRPGHPASAGGRQASPRGQSAQGMVPRQPASAGGPRGAQGRGQEPASAAGRGHGGAAAPAAPEQSPSVEGLRYERAYPEDKRLAKVVTIAKSKKFRDKHGKILLEGRRLITDALEAGAVLQTLFFSTTDQLKELPLAKLKQAQLIKVKFEDIKMWSDLVTPQGVMGIFGRPDHSKMSYPAVQLECSLPLSLICDNIRDPGNLGTILRSAAGAGCNKVLLTKGCVDAWEPKVLRAGMGAHFRIPVITSLEWEVLPNYLPGDTRVCVADNCSLIPTQDDVGYISPTCQGTSMSEKASDYGWVSTHPKRKGNPEEDYYSSGDESEDSEDEEPVGNITLPELDVQSYTDEWAQAPSALVIGGETYGLSLESLQLAESRGGARLVIPVVPGMDSLNSAMAASILLFEGKRQLRLKVKLGTRSKRLSA